MTEFEEKVIDALHEINSSIQDMGGDSTQLREVIEIGFNNVTEKLISVKESVYSVTGEMQNHA